MTHLVFQIKFRQKQITDIIEKNYAIMHNNIHNYSFKRNIVKGINGIGISALIFCETLLSLSTDHYLLHLSCLTKK